MRDEITVISAQQRQILALLRQLIEMLLPKADPGKPKLEDLIAGLVGQQTRILVLLTQIGSDVSGLPDRIAAEGRDRPNGHHAGGGGAQR